MTLYQEEIAMAYELRQSGVDLQYIAEGLGVSVRGLKYALTRSESNPVPPRPAILITKARIKHTNGRARYHISKASMRAEAVAEERRNAVSRVPYIADKPRAGDEFEREASEAVRKGNMAAVPRPRGHVLRARKAASASFQARKGPFGDLAIAAQLRAQASCQS